MDKYIIVNLVGANTKQQSSMKIWDYRNPSADPPAAASIAAFLAAESYAGIKDADLHEEVSIVGTDPAATANLDYKLKVTANPPTTVGGKDLKFVVPAPKATGELTRHGRRATKAEGDAIVAAWQTANGIAGTYRFKRGIFVQRV